MVKKHIDDDKQVGVGSHHVQFPTDEEEWDVDEELSSEENATGGIDVADERDELPRSRVPKGRATDRTVREPIRRDLRDSEPSAHWSKPLNLPVPPPQNGWRYKYVNPTANNGKFLDRANQKGYVAVREDELARLRGAEAMRGMPLINSIPELKGYVVRSGQLLCKIPIDLWRQIKLREREQTEQASLDVEQKINDNQQRNSKGFANISIASETQRRQARRRVRPAADAYDASA